LRKYDNPFEVVGFRIKSVTFVENKEEGSRLTLMQIWIISLNIEKRADYTLSVTGNEFVFWNMKASKKNVKWYQNDNSCYLKSCFESKTTGAGGGSRTHKVVTPEDFKSSASAYSATPACEVLWRRRADSNR
jgi:hypothetical protein